MSRLSAAWAAAIVEGLWQGGVRDVVISPGSRSTPLAHAALTQDGLRAHRALDERSGGFLAVGYGKASGRPAALICTSGTAPAHYYPAVIEASESGVPLVVLSADRPAALRGTGANQTIDQEALFGRHVRTFVDLGEPSAHGVAEVRERARGAVRLSRASWAGPVHLNAPFEKPLEPDAVSTDELVLAATPAHAPSASAPAPVAAPDGDLAACLDDLGAGSRGLIVVGAVDPHRDLAGAVFALAARTGFPVVSEATGQARLGPAPDGVTVLDGFAALTLAGQGEVAPEVLLSVGRPPTLQGWEAWRARHGDARQWVLTEGPRWDPTGHARGFLVGEVRATLGALADRAPAHGGAAADWVAGLRAADTRAWQVTARVRGDGAFSEALAVARLVERLPEGATLVVGSSLPVRHLDLWAERRDRPLSVLSHRGASGIDGFVASAAGARAASRGGMTALLLGDVSLLHDVGSLELMRHVRGPLPIVVLHNDGGRIFDTLPVAMSDALRPELAWWTTPHGVRFRHAAALYGLGFEEAADARAFDRALHAALCAERPTLIEVMVDPGDAAGRQRALVEVLRAEFRGRA